jgi:two-component SAPR family response regulator
MIRIAVVDDELHVLDRFARLAAEVKELDLCGLFETGEQLLGYLQGKPLDAVFLDIEMPHINGLELSEKILDLDENIEIIFITAFHQYAVEAFEVHALDYIMKPLTEERLRKTVGRLLKRTAHVKILSRPYVQCFGSFELIQNGETLPRKNSRAREILAFLIHKEGDPVSWDQITEAVWPDIDYEKAHVNFHATSYLLRKRLSELGLSDILESTRGNYRIRPEKVTCDLYEFKNLVNKSNAQKNGAEDFNRATTLYRGGYMEDNGYAWAYSRAAELDDDYKRLKQRAENKI